MTDYLQISQMIISILLIVTVLLQVRGTGSGIFGGTVSSFRTRRGVEQTLFRFTIVLGVLFVLMSLLSLAVT